jgi:hypothetical protein
MLKHEATRLGGNGAGPERECEEDGRLRLPVQGKTRFVHKGAKLAGGVYMLIAGALVFLSLLLLESRRSGKT